MDGDLHGLVRFVELHLRWWALAAAALALILISRAVGPKR